MRVFRKLEHYQETEPLVVTIGTFDGVHYGHRAILRRIRDIAQEKNLHSALITFEPHPRIALQKDVESLRLLNTDEEKIRLLSEEKIDHVFVVPFDESFHSLSAKEFVEEILLKKLHAQVVVIGYDHRFGKNRQGDIDFLRQMGSEHGFVVEEIPKQQVIHMDVSSTKIRQALQERDLLTANTLLSKPYLIRGTVVKGDQLGRTLGFPTANIECNNPYKLLPSDGIYAAKAGINNRILPGMLYIGHRPSLQENSHRIEMNVFDFDEDLYGKKMDLWLYSFIREDQHFQGLEALTEALQDDERRVRAYFGL